MPQSRCSPCRKSKSPAGNPKKKMAMPSPKKFNCFANDTQTTESGTIHSVASVPTIALVNGLSGGHKGEKVERLLKKRGIPSYDLLLLSTNQDYFDTLITQLGEIYDELIEQEQGLLSQADSNDRFRIHPRVLIGGGDGSIAWALSTLDRAFLTDRIVSIFARRHSVVGPLKSAAQKRQVFSEHATVSTDFYYARSNTNTVSLAHTPAINALSEVTTFEFEPAHEISSIKEKQAIHVPEIHTTITVKAADATDSSHTPNIEISVHVCSDEHKSGFDDEEKMHTDIHDIVEEDAVLESACSSSASTSAANQNEILEDFLHTELTQDDPTDTKRPKEFSPGLLDVERENSLSGSFVTAEEIESVRHGKKSMAMSSNKQSMDDLRMLQHIYDSNVAPVIALIPLGTGNDLSRCLGTGWTYPGSKELVENLIAEYKIAPITKLDRWKIQFLDEFQVPKKRQTSELLCYFSVGFEGLIAYRFACARTKNPKLFDRPWKNKLQYVMSGIGAGFEEVLRITKPLNESVEVYVDDVPLKLPSNTRSIVVSSIQSMADGVYFWGKGQDTKKDVKEYSTPELGDGKLEVMASKGIYKYLQMRVGMSHYRRMAQPKKVTIVMKQEQAIQVDGESWVESEGTIHICLLHQVFAVVGKNEPRGVRII